MRPAIALFILLVRLTAFAAVVAISAGLLVQELRAGWFGRGRMSRLPGR